MDARDVLHHIPPGTVESIDPSYLADSIFAAVVMARCLVPTDWPRIWPEVEPPTVAFLRELEARVGAPQLVTRAMRHLERHVLKAVASPMPVTIGGTHATTIEVTTPVEDIHLPCGVERLHLTVTLDGERLGDIELPVFSETVSSHLLADAIADRFSWQILDCYFSRTIYPHLAIQQAGPVTRVRRGDAVLLEVAADEASDLSATLHERLGWMIFLQELWDRPAWLTDHFYDPEEPNAGPYDTIESDGREWIAVEISRDLPGIAADRAVQVIPTVAGVAQGAIEVPAAGRAISPQQLRAAILLAGGLELGRACVREALIGRPLDGPPLRERLNALSSERQPVHRIDDDSQPPLVAGHVRIGDLTGSAPVYARRESAPSLTSISRLAIVPAGTADDLLSVPGERPDTVFGSRPDVDGWYVPEIVPLTVLPSTIVTDDGRDHQRSQRPPIAVKAMRRVARKAGLIAPRLEPGQAAPTQEWEQTVFNHGLVPVLMYHRVSPTGAENTARYRVTPEAFEAQLAYLRDAGYQSVSVDELAQAIETRRSLPGKRVLLTFDDAYVDFAEYGWPLLKQYGFGAILFVVSGLTGKTNEWDRRYGEELPLLGWDALRELDADGVTIGAHSVSHQPMSGLSPREVAYEAAESRRAIQQHLGTPVSAFAYPYGDRDEAVERITGACGITLAFTTRSYLMHVNDAPLSLPRIEVQGNESMSAFIRSLTV
jgi:peptidoglycan/xylan/chitin deacetylase (PgdA/CDA1 family)